MSAAPTRLANVRNRLGSAVGAWRDLGRLFFFARIAVAEMPPLVLVFWRVAIAAAALQVYLTWPAQASASRSRIGARSPAVDPQQCRPVFADFPWSDPARCRPRFRPERNDTVLDADDRERNDARRKTKLEQSLGDRSRYRWNRDHDRPRLFSDLGAPAWAKFALIGASLSYAFALMVAKRLKNLPPPVVGNRTADRINIESCCQSP